MTLDNIIIALNRYINKVNPEAVLVIQKEVNPCKLKLFKDIKYTLWYIDKLRKAKFRVLTLQSRERIDSQDTEERVYDKLEIEFMTTLFQYIRGEEFKLILGGSYEGNESILDQTN